MASSLASSLVGVFSFLKNKYLISFIISCFPILELRGGLLAASCILGLPPIPSIIVCYLGNLLPILFILLFIMPIFEKLKKTKYLKKVVDWCEKKANKRKKQIEDLKYIGLCLFVAVPLPVTGAWTGALIASLLGMDKKKSFLSIVIGLLFASLIMYIVSYVILGGICK